MAKAHEKERQVERGAHRERKDARSPLQPGGGV